MSWIKNKIIEFHTLDKVIKLIENIRGLYKYPDRMLGRIIPDGFQDQADIVVFAAHPDDEVLGMTNKLIKHRANNDIIKIIYVTNGTAGLGGSWKRKLKESEYITNKRYKEGVEALTLINIPNKDVACLGYPDSGTHRYMESIAVDIHRVLQILQPNRVYVHCMEGGHGDHDITSFIVKSICKKLGFTEVYEWAEYNVRQPIGTEEINFLPSKLNSYDAIKPLLSDRDREIKREMLAIHESQNIVKHYKMGEIIRKSNLNNLEEQLLEHALFPKKRLKIFINKLNQHINNNLLIEDKNSTVKVLSETLK